MPAFDRLLLNPSAETIAQLLGEAVTRANFRCRVNKLTPDAALYQRTASEVTSETEGVRRWIEGVPNPDDCSVHHRGTLLGLAWWTDPAGRKHVRLAGRRLDPFNEFHENRFGPLGPARPALWLLAPDHFCLRTLPEQPPELLALCDCGVIGRPETLGWMGECCGPCHDHLEERERPLSDAVPWTIREHKAAVVGVALTTTGEAGVSASRAGQLLFWDTRTRRVRVRDSSIEEDGPGSEARFASNGQSVALASYYAGLRLWRMTTCKMEGEWSDFEYGYDCLALSANGHLLAGSDFHRTVVWDPTPGRRRRPERTINVPAQCLAFSPDSQTLALGYRERALVEVRNLTSGDLAVHSCSLNDRGVLAVAFAPDGQSFAVGMGNPPVWLDDAPGRPPPWNPGGILWFQGGQETVLEEKGSIFAVAFTPDSQTLAAAGDERVIRFWALPEGRLLGGLEWHVGMVTSLTFSPDGNTLVSGGADGLVRFWPWRQLLGVPASAAPTPPPAAPPPAPTKRKGRKRTGG